LTKIPEEVWYNLLKQLILKDDNLQGRKIELQGKKYTLTANKLSTHQPFQIIAAVESSDKLAENFKEIFLNNESIRISINKI
jgi:hypothetical protein